MVEWIKDGALNDKPEDVVTVTDLTLYPPKLVLEGAGARLVDPGQPDLSDGRAGSSRPAPPPVGRLVLVENQMFND